MSFSVDDHRKIVSMLPQSHVSIHLASTPLDDTRLMPNLMHLTTLMDIQTCDNILELPNYYESLVKLHRVEHPNTRTPLPTEISNRIATQCARILEVKLTQVRRHVLASGMQRACV